MENIHIDNLATKDDIKAVRNDMATKDDIKAVRNDMATKDSLNRVFTELDTKIDKKTEALFDTINDFKNEMLENFDKQGKILERLDHETLAHTQSYKDHQQEIEKNKEVLDDHEQRIGVLELKPTTA